MTSYALRAECRGHEDDVRAAVVLSPASFATASRDKTVRVWSEAIGSDVSFAQSVVCVGHASFVTSLAFAPPGRVPSFPPLGALVSGSRDARVVAWDPATGDAVAEMRGHALDVTAVCVLASGVVVSGAMDKSVRVWDPKTGACARAIEDAHVSSVLALAALADGGFLSGSADRSVKRWDGQMPYDGASWKPTTTMTGHADTVRGICVTPAGDAFLTASHDCTARMWSLVTHETVLTFVGHTALVYAVAAAGDRVFTGSEDNTMRIWSARDASCAQTIAHPGCVWSVAAFPIGGDGNGGGGDVISCCADGVARVWTTDDAKKDAAAAKARSIHDTGPHTTPFAW